MNLTLKTVIFLCLLPFIHSVPVKPKDDPEPPPRFELPDIVWPKHYDLELTVDIGKLEEEKAFYDGHVEITIVTTNDTITSVSVHCADNIEITDAQLIDPAPPTTQPPTDAPTTEAPTTETPTTEAPTTEAPTTEAPTTETPTTETPTTEAPTTETPTTETPTTETPSENGGGEEGSGSPKKLELANDDNLLADGEPVYDAKTQILTYNLKDNVKLVVDKEYILKFSFHAQHRDDMNGFYRSSYNDSKNDIHRLVTTQFEAANARSAWPCFDEPRFKAPWVITVKIGKDYVDNGYHVLSNTAVESGYPTDVDDFKVFKFEETSKKIATYLIAVIVSDFKGSENVEHFNDDDKPFRTWGQARYIDNKEDQLSQLAGPAVLDIMSKLTKVPFGLKKLDQVGIPDFSAGAMENWGLTTYRERMLFFNDESNSESTKQSTVGVTAHELAHQWFGDLVTLHSWDDIWLNEGFADFFEYHAAAKIDYKGLNTQDWQYLEQFVVSELQGGAFETDGLPSSRPLTSAASDPNVIEGNFDNIAYSKGGSVIRMWNHILGDDIFYDGLNRYLTKNAEENGTPELLLKAFQDAATAEGVTPPVLPDKVSVSDAFADWHKEPGYPVVNVTRVGNSTYALTQERFLWKVDESGKKDASAWHIPISCSTSDKPQFEKTAPTTWIKKGSEQVNVTVGKSDVEKPAWLVINNRETGYYRVNYEEENWKDLADILMNNHTHIDQINRAQIVDDALSLARSTAKEYLSYSTALPLTSYLVNEQDYVPWVAASNGFSFLTTKLSSDASYQFLQQHILQGVEARYKELGLNVNVTADSHIDRLLRILIASWACKLGHLECVADAQELYTSDAVPADVKSTVYCTVVRNGDEAVFEDVKSKYINSDNNLDQTIFLSAMGCSRNESVLNDTLLETIKTGSIIRQQDLSAAFSAIYNGNPENVKVTLAFLNDHLDDIANTYGGMNPLGGILIGLANKVVAEEDIKTLNTILDTVAASSNPKVQAAATSVPLARDVVVGSQHWLEGKQEAITSWLKDTYDETPATDGPGGAAGLTFSIVTIITCLALLFSH